MKTLRRANTASNILVAALGLIIPILLSQQIPASITYQVGESETLPNIDGLYQPETGVNGPFRWTHELVSIRLEPLGYPLHITLHVQGVRPEGADPAEIRTTSDNKDLGLIVLPGEAVTLTYRLPLSTISQINPNITLNPTTFQPPGDSRTLGVVLYSVEERNAPGPWPAVPSIWVAIAFLLGGLFAYLTGAVGLQNRFAGTLGVWSWGVGIGLLNAFVRPWLVFHSWYLVILPLVGLAIVVARRDFSAMRSMPREDRPANPEIPAISIRSARLIAGVIVISSLSILAWHMLAPNEAPGYDPRLNATWGVSSFTRLPGNIQIAGILAVLGSIGWAFFAPSQRRTGKIVLWEPDTWPDVVWRWLPLALVLVGVVAFTIFPVAYSDGDSYLWFRIARRERVFESEPLDTYIKFKLFDLLYPLLPTIPSAFEVIAVFAGGIYVAGAFALASTLGRNRREALILLVGLFGIGNIVFFFRYVETYALMTAVGVWLIWGCWRYVEGKLPFTAVAAIFAVGVLCHGAILWETPMIAVALLLGPASLPLRQRVGEYLRIFSYGSIVGLAIMATFAGIVILDGFTAATLLTTNPGLGGADRQMFVPMTISDKSSLEYFTFFSWNHLAAIIQEQLLTAPMALVSLIAIMLLAWKDVVEIAKAKPAVLALGAGVASTLLFAVMWNPDLGPRIDWDLFALPAVPLTVFVLYLLLQLPGGKPRRLALAAYLSLSIVHTIGWLLTHTLHIGF